MGRVQFMVTAHDSKLTLGESNVLWQAVAACGMEEPMGVFWSSDALQKVILKIKSDIDAKRDVRPDASSLIRKLYDMRTKLEQAADRKRGLPSSRQLGRDIKVRIVFPGQGLFTAMIVNNTDMLVVSAPTRSNNTLVKLDEWVHKTVTVYVWLEGDAEYCFDTEVMAKALFFGRPALHLKHSNEMIRIQKRRAIRAQCKIYGDLYIIKNNEDLNFDRIETKKGYRCLIEDISETGALIQIAGRGQPRVKIRIQFELGGKLVAMFGIVRTVEFNETKNRSRLHFECLHISDAMRNHILAYVYNTASDADIELADDSDETEEMENSMSLTATGAPAQDAAAADGASIDEVKSSIETEDVAASLPPLESV